MKSRGVREEQRECESEGEVAGLGLSTSSRTARPCTQWANVLLGRASRFGGRQFKIPNVVTGIRFLVSDKILRDHFNTTILRRACV